jgi:hypothetical protein
LRAVSNAVGRAAAAASAAITAPPRRLALALYAAFSDADGIAYRARHNNGEICYALFDRVSIVGLVPAKEMPATLNARAESVARKPMFRNACKQRRRIIPPTASQWWKVR